MSDVNEIMRRLNRGDKASTVKPQNQTVRPVQRTIRPRQDVPKTSEPSESAESEDINLKDGVVENVETISASVQDSVKVNADNRVGVDQKNVTDDVTVVDDSVAVSTKPEHERQQAPRRDFERSAVPADIRIERTIPDEQVAFAKLSASEKLTFGDLFVKSDGLVQYNKEYRRTVAKNLPMSVMDQVIDDLKKKHLGHSFRVGKRHYTIDDSNAVFSSVASAVRFMMLNQMQNEQLALKLARQLFLEKYPDGESESFNVKTVRSDELDVYIMLMASKSDPTKDLYDKVQELTYRMSNLQETTRQADSVLLNQGRQNDQKTTALVVAVTTLLMERFGLTQGSVPKDMHDFTTFLTQDVVMKATDTLQQDVAVVAKRRDETIARDRRVNGRRVAAQATQDVERDR